MAFNHRFLARYLEEAPVALSIERAMECELLSREEWAAPILDLGCGDGLFAQVLFDKRIDTGIDVQAGELTKARARGAYLELIECRADRVPKASGMFRTVFANSVLEHIPDLGPALGEVRRVLVDQGLFYVTVPTDRFERLTWGFVLLNGLGLKGLARYFAGAFNRFWRHYHYYPVRQWQEVFERQGFKTVKSIVYGSRRVCLLEDFFLVFAIPGFIIKKLFNRWFLLPGLRRAYAPLLAALLSGFFKQEAGRAPDGGLVFFVLRKA